MPKIKPFRAIHPSQEYVDKLSVNNKNWSSTEVQKNPYSVLPLLIPKLEEQLAADAPQPQLTTITVSDNVARFVDEGWLVKDVKPVIYVYQIKHADVVQTGIWTVTAIDDYISGTIKKHELTRAEREQKIVDHLEQTGVDANPVLLAYFADPSIQAIISETIIKKPSLYFQMGDTFHQLWKIDDVHTIASLVKAFANIGTCYIADGHHRMAASATLGIAQREINNDYDQIQGYNYFNSVYMSTDQLQVFEFNRLVQDMGGISVSELLNKLTPHFEVRLLDHLKAFSPQKRHDFGMYVDRKWYQLRAKPHTYSRPDFVSNLDTNILQNYILDPILNIDDPRTNARLSFVGGMVPLQVSVNQINKGDYAILFTLFPTSIEQLTTVADAGQIMPPKSTWFEPKFQSGIMVHQLFEKC